MTSLLREDSPFLSGERYLQAVNLFNHQDWYAAHDAFEELWYESVGEERSLLQGIIQIAVAEHHLSLGNLRGALLLMAEGLNHLQSSALLDLAFDLQPLRDTVGKRLSALQLGQTLVDIPVPSLVRSPPEKD